MGKISSCLRGTSCIAGCVSRVWYGTLPADHQNHDDEGIPLGGEHVNPQRIYKSSGQYQEKPYDEV